MRTYIRTYLTVRKYRYIGDHKRIFLSSSNQLVCEKLIVIICIKILFACRILEWNNIFLYLQYVYFPLDSTINRSISERYHVDIFFLFTVVKIFLS